MLAAGAGRIGAWNREPEPAPTNKEVQQPAALDWEAWAALDAKIRAGWMQGRTEALEPQIRKDPKGNLLFLPRPYITPNGSPPAAPAAIENDVFREMYNWDTCFINRDLLAHNLPEPVRDHILNHLLMIDRFGYMPNGNRAPLSTRSQIPIFRTASGGTSRPRATANYGRRRIPDCAASSPNTGCPRRARRRWA